MSAEEWRLVPGFEGAYQVSDSGRVRSLNRIADTRPGVPTRFPGRVLATHEGNRGHLRVGLHRDGINHQAWVHRLVLAAFVGPIPEGMEVRHLDGDPHNNFLFNLAYGTHSENVLDSVRHGTHSEARKTRCNSGHEFTPPNTRIDAKGARECIACRRIRNRKVNDRRNAERAARGKAQYLRVAGEDTLTAIRELYAANPRLTQKEIAARLGVGQSTISRWVRGQTRPDIPGPITSRGKGWRAA